MNPLVTTYVVYLAIAAYVTIVVGYNLHKHGRPFLIDIFSGNSRLADSINHLLLVGYYLTNGILVTQTLTCHVEVTVWGDLVRVLGEKIGFMLLVLAGMHSFNLIVLHVVQINRSIYNHTPRTPPRPLRMWENWKEG